jgi:hypothetical protein
MNMSSRTPLPLQSIPGPSLRIALMEQPSWVRGLLLTLFCIIMAMILLSRTHVLTPQSPEWAAPYDHHKYVYMAEHPVGRFHIAPPCWRIAAPLLVRELPFNTLIGFRVQTFAFLVATAVLLHYVLLAAGYPELEAFLGVLMFWSYGAATKLLLANPYSPDPASFAVSLAALYLLLKNRDILLAVTLVLGAIVKETIVLIIPLVYTIRASRGIDLRLLMRTAFIGSPALLVLVVLRLWIPPYNDVESYVRQMGPQLTQVHLGTATFGFLDALHRVTAARLLETPVNIARDLTYRSVGILWILPFFALRSIRPCSVPNRSEIARSSNLMLLVRFLPFLALTYLGYFMALNVDRRFTYAFPFWIMMSLNGVRSLASSWNIHIVWFLPIFLFQYILNLIQPLTAAVPVDIAVGALLITLGILFSFRGCDRTTIHGTSSQ